MSTHIINFPGADIHTTTLTSVSNVSVGENLDVTSNLTVSGNATVSGNVEMSSNLTVSGNATVSGNVEMSSNLTVSGDTTVSGNVEMSSNLTVSGNVELSSNLTVSGNVGVGVTNPTTRFAVLDEARQSEEFPPRAMTDYETHMEGHGVFKVSESSVRSGEDGAYALFTKDDGTTFWHSDNTSTDHRYTQDAAGTYSGTSSFDGIDGEWVTLECPYSIKLDSIQLHIRSLAYQYQSPEDWALLGSNDGTNWGTLKEVTGQIISESGTSFDVSTSQYYKMFALVVTRIANNVAGSYTNALTFGEWRLFGTRERGQSTLHDGELKLNKSLMVPRIGPPLDTDDTPRRDRLVVEYNTSTNPTENGVVQDTSGNGLDGVLENTYSPGNATYDPYYDATEKALVFDGSNDYVTKNLTGISGDFIFSASLWVYHESSTNNAAQFFTIGNNATNQMVGFRLNSSMTSAYVYFYSADTLTATISTVLNTWNHFVVTYDGSTQRLYQNGVLVESNSGSGLNLPQDPELRIGHRPSAGSTEYLDGYLSNFKLYDVALTADEVKRLYDMGRLGNVIAQPVHIAAPLQVEKTLRVPIDSPAAGTTGMIRFNTTLGKLEVYNGTIWLAIGGMSASGGTVTYADGYTIHTFTSSDDFMVYSPGEVELLVVGGGGAGGGGRHAGGGGGGAVVHATGVFLSNKQYTVTVGDGGAGAAENVIPGSGDDSSISDGVTNIYEAIGGGAGGSHPTSDIGIEYEYGQDGGCGGGGGHNSTTSVSTTGFARLGLGLSATPAFGGNGAPVLNRAACGGGGGAGANGQTGTGGENDQSGNGGDGGDGYQTSITGTALYWAGGGGSTASPNTYRTNTSAQWAGGDGGKGGGGGGATGVRSDASGSRGGLGGGSALNPGSNGAFTITTDACHGGAGGDNTGGGGGGAGGWSTDGNGMGGNGGSGIVIIRYLT